MKITIELEDVCAKQAVVLIDQDRIIRGVSLTGGCDGQGKVLNALLTGMPVCEAVQKLKNIKCGHRETSCSAELVKALDAVSSRKD